MLEPSSCFHRFSPFNIYQCPSRPDLVAALTIYSQSMVLLGPHTERNNTNFTFCRSTATWNNYFKNILMVAGRVQTETIRWLISLQDWPSQEVDDKDSSVCLITEWCKVLMNHKPWGFQIWVQLNREMNDVPTFHIQSNPDLKAQDSKPRNSTVHKHEQFCSQILNFLLI